MSPMWCLAAWSVRTCHDCAHNPANQRGMPKGPDLHAKPKKDGRCANWKAAKKVAA